MGTCTSHTMEQFASPSDERSERRKPKLWDRIKHNNSSSPSLHNVGNKNWSSRSLPRLGSFGSLALSSSSTANSSPANSPVLKHFTISGESVVPEEVVLKDYFSSLPNEVKLQIFSYLPLKTLTRVSLQWKTLCTDGALLSTIDTRTFYRNITSPILLSLLTSAGPFLHHLNLRGCAQLRSSDLSHLATRATNLISLSLEGCPIKDGSSLSSLISRNPNLKNLDVSGLEAMTDEVALEVAENCPDLEVLDLGWCSRLTGVGLLDIVSFCPRIGRLRLCENTVFNSQQNRDIMLALRDLENLQDLVLNGCRQITDEMLRFYLRGNPPEPEAEIRPLPIRYLSLSRIPNLTDATLRNLAGATPRLERLELAGTTNGTAFTNAGFAALLRHIPNVTHLDLEDNHLITDTTLHALAHSPPAKSLIHLQLSYCLEITDSGLVEILQQCTHLRNLEVDNTQAGDRMLMEAPRLVARRVSAQGSSVPHAPVGLRIAAYDCGNITWVGVSEVLAQNLALIRLCNASRRDSISSVFEKDSYSSPSPIIRLKCTFEWQKLVDAHTRRCLRGEYAAAEQIGLGFARWMMEETEEGMWGGHARRRRRRALGIVDPGDEAFVMGVGRRRLRAFSAASNCLVM